MKCKEIETVRYVDSLHLNPQTGLARYNEIFDRDAFVYDRTRDLRAA